MIRSEAMRSLPFYKMQGCGNDYVFVNAFEHELAQPASLARRVADRNFGVGSDGLIVLAPPKSGGDARMIMYNTDGSEAEMCGNGLRCLARLAYELGITRRRELQIETGGGTRRVELVFEGARVVGARVWMGRPSFERADVPMTGAGSSIDHPLKVEGVGDFLGTGVALSNPHFVIFRESVDDALVRGAGPKIERHPDFPSRVNVEFIQVVSRSALRMRVWERGSGETLACGTGAAAAVAAAIATRRTERRVIVGLRGGDLELEWPHEDSELIMTGPAVLVYKGELFDGF